MWQEIILLSLVAAAGLVLLIRPLLPVQPRLDAALDRMQAQAPALSSRDQRAQSAILKLGRLAWRHLPRILAPSPKDLHITGTDPAQHVGKKALFALCGLGVVSFIVSLWALVGLHLPFTASAGAALTLGIVGFILPDFSLRNQAAKARLEAARASVTYLLLSSISRASGAGIDETMHITATSFDNPAYIRLRDVLRRTRWSGTSPWVALQEEGRRTGVPETTEVGDIMRLAGEADAAVTDTLRARSKSLRETLLAREIAMEKNRTSTLALPIGLIAIVFVLGVMYPPIARLIGT